ncbi:MAG: rotamase [Alphaproteobacteria bacterium CG_4_9_14_3_um_filter_47_13]|nr:MAG: rotamase [Alphaproteobacteria bacterium CG_4_9_14_3_um_filter_47_13]
MRHLIIGFLTLSLITTFAILPATAQQMARVETIAAVINEDVISESDLLDRMRLVIASSGMTDSKEIRERMMPRIMGILIEEKLKLQEAARLEIAILPEEIERGFASIAAQNNFTPEQFRMVLNKTGVSAKTLEDQIRAQIAWSKIVQVKLRPQILVSDNEVDVMIKRFKANEGKTEYLVSGIFLPVENPAEESGVRQLADNLTRQILEDKVPFPRLAVQFSQAPGATKGGDMGWVQEGQLPEEIDSVLGQLQEGELSKPIRTLSGYHIIHVRSKRMTTAQNIPSRDEIMNNVGLERLDRLQRSYLLDLKTGAFIEHRV